MKFKNKKKKKNSRSYTLKGTVDHVNKKYAFIEIFGENGSNQTQSNWDLGLTYLIKDNLQADISYGKGINNQLSYLSVGAAWNFSLKSSK